jgi:hypothetical protein
MHHNRLQHHDDLKMETEKGGSTAAAKKKPFTNSWIKTLKTKMVIFRTLVTIKTVTMKKFL